jgi:hypothetical protein
MLRWDLVAPSAFSPLPRRNTKEHFMKTFVAIYLGGPEAMSKWQELPEPVRAERRAAGMAAWYAWDKRHRDSIVNDGAPLGRTKAVSGAGERVAPGARTPFCGYPRGRGFLRMQQDPRAPLYRRMGTRRLPSCGLSPDTLDAIEPGALFAPPIR